MFKNFLFSIFLFLTCATAHAQLVDFYFFEYSSIPPKVIKDKNIIACDVYNQFLNSNDTTAFLESSFSFNKEGYRIAEIEYFENTPDIKINHAYNEKRQVVQTDWVWLDPFEDTRTVYEYDSTDRLTHIIDYQRYDTTELFEQTQFHRIIYDTNGNLKELVDENDSTVLIYVTEGDTTYCLKPDSSRHKQFVNGLIIEEFPNVKRKTNRTLYRYDEHDYLIEILRIDIDDKIQMQWIFKYNDGLLVEEQKLNQSGFIVKKKFYRYKIRDTE